MVMVFQGLEQDGMMIARGFMARHHSSWERITNEARVIWDDVNWGTWQLGGESQQGAGGAGVAPHSNKSERR